MIHWFKWVNWANWTNWLSWFKLSGQLVQLGKLGQLRCNEKIGLNRKTNKLLSDKNKITALERKGKDFKTKGQVKLPKEKGSRQKDRAETKGQVRQQGSGWNEQLGVMFEKRSSTLLKIMLTIWTNLVQVGILHHFAISPTLNPTRQYPQKINAVDMLP